MNTSLTPATRWPPGLSRRPIERREKAQSEQYDVLRGKGTERAFIGSLRRKARLNIPLCGLRRRAVLPRRRSPTPETAPSLPSRRTSKRRADDDFSYGMHRVEVNTWAACVATRSRFGDGQGRSGERYCINPARLEATEQ